MGVPVVAIAAGAKFGKRAPKLIAMAILIVVALVMASVAGVTVLITLSTPAVADVPEAPAPAPGLPVSGDWTVPVGGPYSLTSTFGPRNVEGCSYCSTNHKGVDLAQGCGGEIRAAGGGRVITAGPYAGYGNTVMIDHGDGSVTLYGHMEWGSLLVNVSSVVKAGDPIGAEGNTGNSFGCHLHFEVRQRGVATDPIPYMSSRGVEL